jgi:hypothetical protein
VAPADVAVQEEDDDDEDDDGDDEFDNPEVHQELPAPGPVFAHVDPEAAESDSDEEELQGKIIIDIGNDMP